MGCCESVPKEREKMRKEQGRGERRMVYSERTARVDGLHATTPPPPPSSSSLVPLGLLARSHTASNNSSGSNISSHQAAIPSSL